MRSHLSKRTGEYVPTMSEFERRVSDLAEEAGLRRPDRQIAVQLPDTTVYIDLGWREVMVGVECDGLFNHADSVRLPWDEATPERARASRLVHPAVRVDAARTDLAP